MGWKLEFTVAALVIVPLLLALYFRVSGDLAVCREYYPEMSRAACYFSSKTVRVPR